MSPAVSRQAERTSPVRLVWTNAENSYRHLRGFGVTRIAGGSVAAAAGVVCLAYGVYGWAAFFLVLAALNLAGGYWFLAVTHTPAWRAATRRAA